MAWEAGGAELSSDVPRGGVAQAQGREGGDETGPEPCAEWLAAIWEWIGAPWPDDVRAIDARLRALARELAWRDLELGALCLEVEEEQLWRAWGHASMDHYCRERIGMAPATVASRVALGRRIRRLPELADAVAEGCVGYEAATLIARVAGPSTVRAWIDRAEIRTVKLLREEVKAVELVARADGLIVERVGPPDAELLEGVRAIERAVVATVTGVGVGGPMSGGDDESPMSGGDDESPMSGGDHESPMSGGDHESPMSGGDHESPMSGGDDDPSLPRTTLRLHMSEDTARFWRGLEALHDEVGEGRSFVGFLVSAAARSWSSSMPARVAYGDVYVRDRWRCASPVFNCRNTTPHHVKFKSNGGGEERSNLISLCANCHISLVHEGLLSVAGEAPDALVHEPLGKRSVFHTAHSGATAAGSARRINATKGRLQERLSRATGFELGAAMRGSCRGSSGSTSSWRAPIRSAPGVVPTSSVGVGSVASTRRSSSRSRGPRTAGGTGRACRLFRARWRSRAAHGSRRPAE